MLLKKSLIKLQESGTICYNFTPKMNEQTVILFDGICNFCNRSVNFIIRRNTHKDIKFAPLQSKAGVALLEHYGLPKSGLRSFVFIEEGKVYERSGAALRVCRHLNAFWPLCYGFLIVPPFIRDAVYNWIARNRYRWFGIRTECMVPPPDTKTRFIS